MNLTRSEWALYGTSGVCSLVAIAFSVHLMISHLYYWQDARAQLSIVRIVMMVPIYALISWLAILFGNYALYLGLVRDSYESLVLYEFFRLIMHYFIIEAEQHPILAEQRHRFNANDAEWFNLWFAEDDSASDASLFVRYLWAFEATAWPFPLCCMPRLVPDTRFFLAVKVSILQYVFLKPILAFVAVLLSLRGYYRGDVFSFGDSHLWIAVASNVSIAVALFMLVVFYQFLATVIQRHSPLWKFLSIKLLVFFIFWQSLIINVGYAFNLIAPLYDGWSVARSSTTLENLLICLEMPLLSVAHLWIYSVEPYTPRQVTRSTTLAPELVEDGT